MSQKSVIKKKSEHFELTIQTDGSVLIPIETPQSVLDILSQLSVSSEVIEIPYDMSPSDVIFGEVLCG